MSQAVLDLDATILGHSDPSPARDGGSSAHRHARRRRSWLAELLIVPFQDIDERVRIKR